MENRTINTRVTTIKNCFSLQDELTQHGAAVLVDLQELRRHDGYDAWRRKEADDLSALVQARLHSLQNPEDCGAAKKLLCNLNKV